MYVVYFSGGGKKAKLTMKGGAVVDPDSGSIDLYGIRRTVKKLLLYKCLKIHKMSLWLSIFSNSNFWLGIT